MHPPTGSLPYRFTRSSSLPRPKVLARILVEQAQVSQERGGYTSTGAGSALAGGGVRPWDVSDAVRGAFGTETCSR